MPTVLCPVCRLPLQPAPRTWACVNRHSFDVAREGYVNLLLAQQKNSTAPGDAADSLLARRAFLEAGHYAPLQAALVDTVNAVDARQILDIGCGEGYYTAALQRAGAEVIGLDIAKPAIQLAARRHRGPLWLVATGATLPLADAAVDFVCNVFTQLHVREIRRVLAPGGHVLVVSPGPGHLAGLRAGLFDAVHPHEPEKFLAGFEDGFELQDPRTLDVELDLDNTALRQLLAMTPYVWKARPEKRSELERCDRLLTRAEFHLQLWRRS